MDWSRRGRRVVEVKSVISNSSWYIPYKLQNISHCLQLGIWEINNHN